MKKSAIVSIFLCCCLLLAGCGSAQAEADASAETSDLPFSLDLPEGTEVGESDNGVEWILNSDRWVGLDLYPDAIEDPKMIAAGWIEKSCDGATSVNNGVPSRVSNNVIEGKLLDTYDFGWFFEESYEAYTNAYVETYSIPREVNACSFWCAAIPDKSEKDTFYWVALNQLCFTKEEAIEIAKSFEIK